MILNVSDKEQIGEEHIKMKEEKLYCCCFTGHRPEKLSYSENEIKCLLEKTIDRAIKAGYTTFISGMARGTDIWAAEILLQKKKQNKNLKLICAVPHPGFEKGRTPVEIKRYQDILQQADEIKTVSDCYFKACYQKRNEFMVDRSALVIAVWNGMPSGTKNTIDYAKRQGVAVVNVLAEKIEPM